ncbi:Bromodomain-containing protein [Pelagophyceae sp. CCMP2097]|nr:Bromodomain-containing protein [Pelagophyceae sp. CCMP2097]
MASADFARVGACRRTVELCLAAAATQRAAGSSRDWEAFVPQSHAATAKHHGRPMFAPISDAAMRSRTPIARPTLEDAQKAFSAEKKVAPTGAAAKRKKADEKSVPKFAAPPAAVPKEEPKRKRKKKEPAAPPPARVVLQAAACVDACWVLAFGADKTNPFRTRLSRATCDAMGLTDYYDVVKEPCDLSLVRERLALGWYADDSAVRADIAKIANNAALYNPPDAPVVADAVELLAAFDNELLLARQRAVMG